MIAPRQAEGTGAPPAPSPACRSCAVDGCDRPPHGSTWCGMHYQRWRKHGDPLTVLRLPGPPPPNPFAGHHACPSCGSAAWTLPTSYPGLGPWRCVRCSAAFDPARQEADLLRSLAVDALESDEARSFLGRIPTVGELVPSVRLAELASAIDVEAPK